ncbi:coiled-coil domain-containing protein 85C-B [Galleria mellonella]|uniref:Coiled-coil domain-containing protein 85C-B n=1 Tax=Galleria mellonella TaxID=7137 RepID=A0A6J1WEJ4_GALME|nr:coiled-coil domain-containing protein 85C-B [Galleria mellonella]
MSKFVSITMSINPNIGQFSKQKQQLGKQASELVNFPPRYHPPPPAAGAPNIATVDSTTKEFKPPYGKPIDPNKLHYPLGAHGGIPSAYPSGSIPFGKYPQGYPAGYPLPPGALRVLRPSAEVITKAIVHEPVEPTTRARSADDTQRTQRNIEEEQIHRRSADMLKFTKRVDTEGPRASTDQRRQIQTLLDEIKALKEANRRLSEDNRELRDLCCFLDDDRQKGRKLAREWQRFGRYTASVMRQEVSAYQNKLKELDEKQQELIRDNLQMKNLFLLLDEEHERSTCVNCGRAAGRERDDGDGSSSSTNAEEAPRAPTSAPVTHPQLAERTVQYVRDLEQKVRKLEAEKGIGGGVSERPEAVVRALQVLEVRERVERERRRPAPDLDTGEQALVREMCNVVWGKLEEAPPQAPPR